MNLERTSFEDQLADAAGVALEEPPSSADQAAEETARRVLELAEAHEAAVLGED